MEDRVLKTAELHQKGYNCAQAVFCAYADLFGLDEPTAYKIAEGFGSGMGGLGDTCGALSAIFMLAGLENSSGVPGDKSTRAATYKQIQALAAGFKAEAGAMMCRELKGEGGGPKLYSCPACVRAAAVLFEKHLDKKD